MRCTTWAASTMFALAAFSGCSRGNDPSVGGDSSSVTNGSKSADSVDAATPVHMTLIERGNIAITATGPGRTDALDLQKIRAPFTGVLTFLRVAVGDRVGTGQVVAAVINQPSQAALIGAEAMLRGAATAAQRSDAERALVLAKQNLVATQLRAPRAGVIISRGSSEGDLVSQGDSILTIASAGSIVFVARIAQADLAQVRLGQRANVTLPGQLAPVPGVVHGLLPADTSSIMTVPVRIDFSTNLQTAGVPVQTGLFGTAEIIVGERLAVPIVPAAAILRDDISGISRIALVTAAGLAHWVNVTTGASQSGNIEIKYPALTPGQRVIVSGQVGLPDGSKVREGATSVGAAQ
ncbi:MAG: HlyD family efflux transporter periplasmic adaptor subunit [Gemmatimonadaceae bacterium]